MVSFCIKNNKNKKAIIKRPITIRKVYSNSINGRKKLNKKINYWMKNKKNRNGNT